MKRQIILALFVILAASCKEGKTEEPNNTTEEKKEVARAPQFIVEVEVISEKEEEFEMFFQDYDNLKYSWKTKIAQKGSASSEPQKIRFEMPKNVFPTSLRFDFGKNKQVNNLRLVSLKMMYEDFQLELSHEEFASFFRPNKYVEYDKKTGVITTKEVDGKYDPYFDSKGVFKKKLELEAR